MSIRNVQQNNLATKSLAAPRPIIRPKGTLIPGTPLPWVRDPSWLTLPSVISTDQKFVGLHAVFPNSGNFVALSAAGNYTVDWGDGTTENISSGVQANHSYDFTDGDLAGTDGPVTFTDSGDLVTRNNHGYINGDVVRFYSIVSTTGITEGQYYYVINANTNDFQISTTSGGSAVALTTDGTGSLLPYKQAIVVVTPQGGANLTTLNLKLNHNQSGLYTSGYSSGWLDIILSMPNCTTSGLTISTASGSTPYHTLLEQCFILNSGGLTSCSSMFNNCYVLQSVDLDTVGVTNMSTMFSGCNSLQTVPLFNTASVTTMASMFLNCYSLQTVPLFNTASVTNMSSMFQNCYSLQTVPLFNTANVTNMSLMFSGCNSLQTVPLFNTANVTDMSLMFQFCYSLQTVPLFNTANVTSMSQMFYTCYSLQSVPLFNTASVTNMSSMFYQCFSLQSVPLFNTASVTSMYLMFYQCSLLQTVPAFNTSAVVGSTSSTGFASMFNGCRSFRSIPAMNLSSGITASAAYNSLFNACPSITRIAANPGPKYTFTVTNLQLSATALDEIYTNLPSVSAQTITVTGNYGTASDTPSIATAKGWTVTG